MNLHINVTNPAAKRRFETLEQDLVDLYKDKYNYSEAEYVNMTTKIKIKCTVPGHGYFMQTPKQHLKCEGCRKCMGVETSEVFRARIASTFEKEANLVHDNKYTYDLTDFTAGISREITCFCNEHNKKFKQRPEIHLKGSGCYYCGLDKRTANKVAECKQTAQDKVDKVHGVNRYVININTLTSMSTVADITCSVHNKVFKTKPEYLLQGCGCPLCGEVKQQLGSTNKPTCVYYVKIIGHEITGYKIGITSQKVSARLVMYKKLFREEFDKRVEIIATTKYMDRVKAVNIEQAIIHEHKAKLVGNKSDLAFSLNESRETFNTDIFDSIKHYFN